MFVAIICDIGSEDNKKAVFDLIRLYGFKKIMENVFESSSIKEETLLRLKRDIDKATDFYDKVRFYQFPLDDTLAVTYLTEKRWRKIVLKP